MAVYNLTGEKILSKTLVSDNYKINTNFDTASLAQGIYLVKIIDGNDVLIFKVCK